MTKKQPMNLHGDAEAAMAHALASAKPFAGSVFRIANAGFATAEALLSGHGAMRHGGRWNPRGTFPVCYFSLDLETACAEKAYTCQQYGIPPEQWLPAAIVLVEASLVRSLDLTVPASRRHLGLTAAAMVADRSSEATSLRYEAPRHRVAVAAYAAGIEALVVPSARRRGGRNLVVFPDALDKRSRLVIVNPHHLPKGT